MKRLIFLAVLFLVSCASDSSIFPSVELGTSEDVVALPNPISIVADVANNQIVVANSNVDYLYSQGSLAVLSVDATDTDAPVLTAQQIIEAPNYAVQIYSDGAGSLYVPFRESSESDDAYDTFKKYTLAANSIVEALTGTIADDPFGITGNGVSIYTVSNNVLEIYDANLLLQASVDLSLAADYDIDDSESEYVFSVALDVTNNRAVVSNETGRMFIVNLTTNTLAQAVDGALTSSDLVVNNDFLYILDTATESIMVFDLNALAAPVSPPEGVDESQFILASIGVGSTPYAMALDAVTNRLYVANYGEDSISVIDLNTYLEIDRIFLDADNISTSFLRDGEGPVDVALGTFNGTTYLFVACFSAHDVVMINTTTLNVVEVFPNTAGE